MKKTLQLILLLLVLFLLHCGNQSYKITGSTMGTTYHITVVDTSYSAKKIKDKVDVLLHRINMIFSTYISNSQISKINMSKAKQKISISKEILKLLLVTQNISKETNGMYDITVGPLVNLYGFGPYKKKNVVPSQKEIQRTLKQVGYKKLFINKKTSTLTKLVDNMYLDFSSIAKGYGVDKISQMFDAMKINNYFIEIGGELFVKGLNPQKQKWQIGVELPKEYQQKLFKVLSLSNKAMATSGNYRNFYRQKNKKYFHTIHPKTGLPAYNSLLSTTVIAKNCMLADAYATALMSMGLEEGVQFIEKHNKENEKNQLDVLFIYNKNNSMKTKLLGSMKKYLLK